MPALSFLTRCLDSLRQRARRQLVRRADRRVEVADYCSEIEASRTSLLGFGRKSDEEFTALARGLGKLTGRLNELRGQAEELDRVISDRDEERALESAYTLYKNSIDLVHASAGTAVSAEEQLGQIERILTAVCNGREQFRRNHLLLHVLAINMRIEAARLSPEHRSVFLNVAADTAEIGTRILTGTETAFGRIEGVIAETVAERSELKQLDQVIGHEARQSILTIQKDLDALKLALAPCAEKSREIAALFARAGPRTMQVISSLQHQDIVRQQLEHVADGFQDMVQHLRTDGRIEWTYLRQAGAIQEAQLDAARADIAQAGDAVLGGLQGLLQSHADMVGLFVAMEQMAATALRNCQVAHSFAEEVRDLSKIVERSGTANSRISELVEHICQVVGVFTEEIARHEFDLKIVALNAQIAAAHMPAADALNKLAEETCAASNANANATSELVASLSGGLNQLHRVKRETDEFLTVVSREKAELEAGASQVSRKLEQLLVRVQTGAVRVRREFEPLYRESQALVESVDFPQLIDASFVPARDLCVRLKATATLLANGDELSAEAASCLAWHQKRYTMHKENATHTAALAGAPAAAPAPAPAALPDDVELFGDLPPAPPPASIAAAPGDIELFDDEPAPAVAAAVPAPAASGALVMFEAAAAAPASGKAAPALSLDAPGAEPAASREKPPAARPSASAPAKPPAATSADFGAGIELF